jgi:hypothetical protein
VWLVAGDRASCRVLEGGMFGMAARSDAVIVQELAVSGAAQG